ncbi:MAG: 5-(carboxyamino)imidazole ribonucleotide synthase [Bdellovibrionales bacterium]|nr:5-(carboxyamino)imidazole ribonucleotide synthase [Bdellovibrionales bacterium]
MKTIGILGGGQLSRMLILKAHEMGLGQQVYVMSENAQDPAAQVTNLWTKGSFSRLQDLRKFLKKVDIVTFESEFMDCSLLKSAKANAEIHFAPSLKVMTTLQDRLLQKQSLKKNALPTSDFLEVSNYIQLVHAYNHLNQGHGIVLKARKFGYDGYGTFVIKSIKDVETFTPYLNNPVGFIAERFIPFDRELSLIVVRNKKNDIRFLPLCESFQKDSRCFSVHGPIQKNISSLKKNIERYLKQINYQGVIAFELFETKNKILINETAPRVHNTGHFSQNALTTDQFGYHLLAILNKELPSSKSITPGFAMINLLGTSSQPPQLKTNTAGFLHWYGKLENRPNRKMGHLNIIDSTPQKALQQAKKLYKEFKL